jgi:hypothetical protein
MRQFGRLFSVLLLQVFDCFSGAVILFSILSLYILDIALLQKVGVFGIS